MAYRQKEACVIVLDAALSNTEKSICFPGMTKFEVGKKVADHYLRRFLQENRKTDEVGIVVLGAAGEDAEGAAEVVLIQPSSMEQRRALEAVAPADSGGEELDLGSAVELATSRILDRIGHLKYQQTVAIVTDGATAISEESLQKAKQSLESGSSHADLIKFEIFGIDFDQNGRSESCIEGQKVLESVFGKSSVTAITPHSAFRPRKRQVSQVKKWTGELELSSDYNCKFHVIMVARIAEEKLKSLEKMSKKALDSTSNHQEREELFESGNAKVQRNLSYYSSEDPDREVAPDDRARGYRYGKDIVPIQPGDEEALQLEDRNQCLKVIGIINRSELQRNYLISPTSCIVANPGASQSQEGFSAFVRALRDLDKVATCRYVRKTDASDPKFVALIPGYLPEGSPAAGSDCLWHIQIPTVEDMRDYPFESLSKFSPTEVESKVALNFVKAMTLRESDAPETNRYDPEHTANPFIARYWEAVHAKALDPERPIPAASPFVTAMITPDPNVVKRADKYAKRFAQVMPLKRTVRRRDRGNGLAAPSAAAEGGTSAEPANDTADVDGDEWFKDSEKSIVDSVSFQTPVEDMWAMLKQAEQGGQDRTDPALDGIAYQIRALVAPDVDPMYYPKALQCVTAFREAALKYYRERRFNDFLTELKGDLLGKDGHNPFWDMVRDAKVTLITSDDSNDVGPLSQRDAEDFLSSTEVSASTQKTSQTGTTQATNLDDDVFEEMD